METMTPREIVEELDKHIVGQRDAKRAVAVALRNRWRRMQVEEPLRQEITPKNILMIGPTGVGKTEIARRLAKLARAPFVKVEATKFTEVGYVGREVDSIVKDLVDVAVKLTREEEMARVRHRAADAAEERILDLLLPRAQSTGGLQPDATPRDAEAEVRAMPAGLEIMGPPGMEDMTQQLQQMFQNLGGQRTRSRKMKVREAMKALTDEEAARMINEEELRTRALANAEQNGIVFLDELDKICKRGEVVGADVSREGVQRDLLPLVEGCTVSTKYGMVKTDHVLFIASGAFHMAKPSDLIPELQGRFPIRTSCASSPSRTRPCARSTWRCWPPRACSCGSRRTASAASPRSPGRSTSARKTSARAACTRSWSACWSTSPSRPPTRAAAPSGWTRPSSTATSASW